MAQGSAGRDAVRWSGPCLLAALQTAAKARGYPASLAAASLLVVARDPASRSPMRVAEAGPWWNRAAPTRAPGRDLVQQDELALFEQQLAERDARPALQARARAQLDLEGAVVDRLSVARRARSFLAGYSLKVGG